MQKTNMRLRLESLVEKLEAAPKAKPSVWPHASMEDLAEGRQRECWEWTAALKPTGHGRVFINGKFSYVHRVVFEAAFGPIPEGMCVCHKCDNACCFNPDHLFLGTRANNLQDMWRKGRQTKERARGDSSPKTIYSTAKVLEMRRRKANGDRIGSLVLEFGGTYQAIKAIIDRKTWKHI